MRLLTREIPPDCDIVLHGDSHEGNVAMHEHGLEDLIAWIGAEPNRFFVHMGDEIEAITTDDKRYQHDTTSEAIPFRQARRVVKRYHPIAKRGLVWLNGNHTFALQRCGNLTQDIVCDGLGIPYGTWTCKLQLISMGTQVCKLYLTHGGRGSIRASAKDFEQRKANRQASLKRRLVEKAGDCVGMFCGHYHQLILVPPARRLILKDDGKRLTQEYLEQAPGHWEYIEPDRRWYGCTGSFLRTFMLDCDGYAERAGYDPVELGMLKVKIRGGKLETVEDVVIG